MNEKNMSHNINDGAMHTSYSCGVVKRSKIDQWGYVEFLYEDNTLVCADISKHLNVEIAYLNQFGLTVTEDGRHFFVQQWTKGLFCFECRTGKLMWQKKGKAYELVAGEEQVVCHFFENGVEAIDIVSGLTVKRIPLGYDTLFRPLGDKHFLIGPKHNKYIIIDQQLNEAAKFSVEEANPRGFEIFVLNGADYAEGGICIRGYEYCYSDFELARQRGELDRFAENSRFSRQICVEF